MSRAIAVLIFPGFQLLDAAGPTTAFEIAERFRAGSYDLALLAPGGGEVESSSGLRLSAEPLREVSFDTVIVSGGDIVRSPVAREEIVAWLKRATARRTASVCSGAYLLAMAGCSTAAAPPRTGAARTTSAAAIRRSSWMRSASS